AVGVGASGSRRTDAGLTRARAAAHRRSSTGRPVGLELAVDGAAVVGDVGAGIALLAGIEIAVAALRGDDQRDRAQGLLLRLVGGREGDDVAARLRDER